MDIVLLIRLIEIILDTRLLKNKIYSLITEKIKIYFNYITYFMQDD